MFFSMLGKLHLAVPHPERELLETVLELVAETIDSKVASDATSRNILTKVQTELLKLMHDIATTDRGGGDEATVLDDTTMRPGDADNTSHSDAGAREDDEVEEEEEDEDEATMQLRREMEVTQLESPEAEDTRSDDTVREYDFSGMADDEDVQNLLDSLADEDDEDLMD